VLRPDFFVMSGLQGLKKFYVRGQVRDNEVRGLTILYDQALEGTWDRIAVAMSSAFAAFPAQTAAAGPAPRRKVEYGTGLVVSAAGDIVTDADLLAGCEFVVVPGFGYAERIAEDRGLALLRVNGASNLAPVALAGGAPGGEVTLVGIADPQAQNGGNAVTTLRGRVVANGSAAAVDPVPGAGFDDVRETALVVRSALEGLDMPAYAKTTGSRGIHVYVRIEPEQSFEEVRRAALALAREVERRMPGRATSRWWKEEREGVFIDYNQNARDRTVASAYSVRAVADARVSCPLEWDEVSDVEPGELRLQTVPARLRERGDPSASIDEHPGRLDGLLELAARDEREGLGDAPWPPHFRKQKGEPPRVQPSRARARSEEQL